MSIPARALAAERGELAFGTMDSWLLFKLTGHRRHVTDASNAQPLAAVEPSHQ
jgi:glycerol kinase